MSAQFQQLERDGYAIFPGFLDRRTTARIREHMDSLLPPVAPPDERDAKRLHQLRHPIPGAIMAEILDNPRLLELARRMLRADELRLLEQVLIRTDGTSGRRGATGWHVDMTFLPRHYEAVPRQTYFHMVHSLSRVAPGGGAFMIVPGSHHKMYAAAAPLRSEDELQQLHRNPGGAAGIDTDEAVEVLPEEGDLLVFNPMALHSASHNATAQPRYVYFVSFFDASADLLQRRLRDTHYRDHFPDSLRDNLRAELRPLLTW